MENIRIDQRAFMENVFFSTLLYIGIGLKKKYPKVS